MPRSPATSRLDCRITYLDQGSGKVLHSEPLHKNDALPQQQATLQLKHDWYTVTRVLDLYDQSGDLRQVNVFLATRKKEAGHPARSKPVKAAAVKRTPKRTRSLAAGSAGTLSSRKRRTAAVSPDAKRRSKRGVA